MLVLIELFICCAQQIPNSIRPINFFPLQLRKCGMLRLLMGAKTDHSEAGGSNQGPTGSHTQTPRGLRLIPDTAITPKSYSRHSITTRFLPINPLFL